MSISFQIYNTFAFNDFSIWIFTSFLPNYKSIDYIREFTDYYEKQIKGSDLYSTNENLELRRKIDELEMDSRRNCVRVAGVTEDRTDTDDIFWKLPANLTSASKDKKLPSHTVLVKKTISGQDK